MTMNEIIRGRGRQATSQADRQEDKAPTVPELLEQMQAILDQLAEQLAADEDDDPQAEPR